MTRLSVPHPFPPCGIPRNHGDEIANALWLRNRARAIAGLIARTDRKDGPDALAILREAALEAGGTWLLPDGQEHWPPSHLGEITVLGVFGAGRNPAELVDNWRGAARRMAREDTA